jgi:hypothetical protein
MDGHLFVTLKKKFSYILGIKFNPFFLVVRTLCVIKEIGSCIFKNLITMLL